MDTVLFFRRSSTGPSALGMKTPSGPRSYASAGQAIGLFLVGLAVCAVPIAGFVLKERLRYSQAQEDRLNSQEPERVAYLQRHQEMTIEDRNLLYNGHVRVGFTSEAAIAAMGAPKRKVSLQTEHLSSETWYYDGVSVSIAGGRVTSVMEFK